METHTCQLFKLSCADASAPSHLLPKLHVKAALTPLGHTHTIHPLKCMNQSNSTATKVNRPRNRLSQQSHHSAKYGLWKHISMSHNFLLLFITQSLLTLISWPDKMLFTCYLTKFILMPSMPSYKGKEENWNVQISLQQTFPSTFISSGAKCVEKHWAWWVSSSSESGLQLLSSTVAVLNFTAVSPCGVVWSGLVSGSRASFSGCPPSGGLSSVTAPVCVDISDVYACLI